MTHAIGPSSGEHKCLWLPEAFDQKVAEAETGEARRADSHLLPCSQALDGSRAVVLRNEAIRPDERRLAIREALPYVAAPAVAVVAVRSGHPAIGPRPPGRGLEHCPAGSLALRQQAVIVHLDEVVDLDICIPDTAM